MKKCLSILLILTSSLSVSVASSFKVKPLHEFKIGDTKVVKENKFVSTVNVYDMQTVDFGCVIDEPIVIGYKYTPSKIIFSNCLKTKKIYLFNCSIRQCISTHMGAC